MIIGAYTHRTKYATNTLNLLNKIEDCRILNYNVSDSNNSSVTEQHHRQFSTYSWSACVCSLLHSDTNDVGRYVCVRYIEQMGYKLASLSISTDMTPTPRQQEVVQERIQQVLQHFVRLARHHHVPAECVEK